MGRGDGDRRSTLHEQGGKFSSKSVWVFSACGLGANAQRHYFIRVFCFILLELMERADEGGESGASRRMHFAVSLMQFHV